jgi:hypothetical protein
VAPTIEPVDTVATDVPTEEVATEEVATEEPTPTEESTTLIVPVDEETPTEQGEDTGGPTSEPGGEETSNATAPLDDTLRVTGISAGGVPIGELRNNSQHTLMVLSSDTSGSDLLVASMSDGSIVADLGAGANPIWSPQGIVLLYQSYAGGAPAAAIYDSQTGGMGPISDPAADGAVQDIPAGWSGSEAFYLRETGDGESTVILFAYDVNTGETREVWRSVGVSLSGGRPIAAGDRFLIATGQSWLSVGTDGSENVLGTNEYGLTGEGVLSPGGSLVAYPAGGQIVVAGVDSPGVAIGLIPYPEGPGAGFSWSPDGEYLAVSDGYSIQVYDENGTFIGAATSDLSVTIGGPQWFDDGIYYVETSPTPSLRRLLLSKMPGFAE